MKASIYVGGRPSCHVLSGKYRRVTDGRAVARCGAVKVEIIGGKPRWKRGERSERNRGGIDDEYEDYDYDDYEDDDGDGDGDRIEEEKMRCDRAAFDTLEIAPSVAVPRIDTT